MGMTQTMEQTKSLPCNVCGTEYVRTTDYWHKQPKHADGLSETCKLCAIARARAHYAANKQRHAENVTAYRKAHPEMLQRERELLKQQRRAANPERFIERTGEEREAAEMERRKRYYKAN